MLWWPQGEPGSSPPTQTPAPHKGPDLQHWCRSRNPAFSAYTLEMLLCDSRFHLSCCAPLILLFDLTPKWQVIANKGLELCAVVVNNNTSVPRLTPRSFWGRDCEGWFIPHFRGVVAPVQCIYHHLDSDFEFISCFPVLEPAVIYLNQHGSRFPCRGTSAPSLSRGPLLHQGTIFGVSSSRPHEPGISLGLASPRAQLTDKSPLYVPHARPKLNCKEQWKKFFWKVIVIEPAISWV